MPTCSQAKIITNLETDIHKKLFKFTNLNVNPPGIDSESPNNQQPEIEITKLQPPEPSNHNTATQKLKTLRKVRSYNDYSSVRISQEHHQVIIHNKLKNESRLKSRRISIDELPYVNEQTQVVRKLPAIYGDYTRKDSVPVNFLYNSNFRTAGRNSITSNQIKINQLRSELNAKNVCSDGEEYEENASTCSDVNNSDKSSLSLGENIKSAEMRRNSTLQRKSIDYSNCLPIRSKRNSLEDSNKEKENIRKYNSISHNNLSGYFSYFPKLALEVETIGNDIKLNSTESVNKEPIIEKKMSIDQAKRLLALASIRPSKTFHKSMTEEEIEVLKKYYEIIKPKTTINQEKNQNDLDKDKIEVTTPIVYNSAKVNFTSLQGVKSFIDTYKKDIELGVYSIDYDSASEPKGFVLKSKTDESVIKFPDELNDTFFALAVSTGDKENQKLGEANLFRIVNWNDTSVFSLNANTLKTPKLTKNSAECQDKFSSNIKDQDKTSPTSSSPTSSTLSFEYIKNLTSLVNSILEPKLLKQLSDSAVDVSVLPGGVNFEMPSFEELGINLNTILGTNASNGTTNGELPPINNPTIEIQSSKLKNSAYKKLKEKVSKARVMWFAAPPERKPNSVIFEYAGVDMGHEIILDEANKYLKPIGGYVVSLEFVPRSVHLNSVYVENLWILTLNDMNTKFFTITNGLMFKDESIPCKSYDEFIFSEYENFIRNEKYKQLIKNHEKAIQNASRRQSKKSLI